MVEAEVVVSGVTLAVVLVALLLVGIAYYRTRIRRPLVLLLLAALLGINMIVTPAERFLEEGVPRIELLSSLFALGIAMLLLATVVRRCRWKPE